MKETLSNLYYRMSDCTSAFVAIIICIFCVIMGFALGLGITLATAWILMSVYNAIGANFNWPTFSIWVWAGIVYILGWIMRGFKHSFNIKVDRD